MAVDFTYAHYLAMLSSAGAVVAVTTWLVISKGSSDAASWVQAIGSIVAIFVTLWITRQDGRRRAEVARQEISGVRDDLVRILRAHANAAQQTGNVADQLASGLAEIGEVVITARGVSVADIGAADADRLRRLRSVAVRAEADAKSLRDNASPNGQHWSGRFSALADEAEAVPA